MPWNATGPAAAAKADTDKAAVPDVADRDGGPKSGFWVNVSSSVGSEVLRNAAGRYAPCEMPSHEKY
eukprot:gene4484-9919_t